MGEKPNIEQQIYLAIADSMPTQEAILNAIITGVENAFHRSVGPDAINKATQIGVEMAMRLKNTMSKD